MRISDWSSDVCSSDLLVAGHPLQESLDLIHDFDLGSHALRRVAANAKDCINRFKRWHPGCPIRAADLLRLASLHAAIMVQFLRESLGTREGVVLGKGRPVRLRLGGGGYIKKKKK